MNKWSATTGTFIIILSLSVSLCAKTGQQSGKTNQQRINDWIRTECEKDPRLQRLNTQADAFGRMLRLRAAHELGISISDLYGIDESSPLSQPSDTGVATNVSKSKFTQQNETTIAIDRALPNIIVAGANDDNMYVNGMPIYSSTNTGKSWSRLYVKAPKSSSGTWVAIGDPVLEAGPDSTLYYAYLWGDPYSQSFPDNLVVATSINGRIWRNGTPVLSDDMIDGFEDKESMCIDNSPMSPHYGRVYIAWVHFDWSGSGETRIAYSDDKCKTWSLPTVIESAPEQFGSVKTGANGEVFVAYSSGAADSLGNPVGIHLLYVSTDGAETFEPRFVHTFDNFPSNITGYSSVKGFDGPRCFPYMSLDVEYRTNTIHLVYGTLWNEEGAAQFYVSSSDLGLTWSAPRALGYAGSTPGDEPILDRFCPAVTVNQRTGDAYMTCYSSERDPDNLLIAPFRYQLNGKSSGQASALEATDFDPMIVSSPNDRAPFVGDYIGADLHDSIYAAAWTEGVDADGEVFVYVGVPKQPTGQGGVGPMLISSDRLRLSSVYPNPVKDGRLTLNVYSPSSSAATVELFDVEGNRVATLWNGRLDEAAASQIECSVPAVAAGTYVLYLRTSDEQDMAKIVVSKR